MKIHKKSAIAVVLAVVILLVIGSCAAANASTRKGCVSKREWKTMIWDSTVNANAKHFGTRGILWGLNTSVVSGDPIAVDPNPDLATTFQTMTVKYWKCNSHGGYSHANGKWWGKHEYLTVYYVGWWPNVVTKFEGFDTLNELRVAGAKS